MRWPADPSAMGPLPHLLCCDVAGEYVVCSPRLWVRHSMRPQTAMLADCPVGRKGKTDTQNACYSNENELLTLCITLPGLPEKRTTDWGARIRHLFSHSSGATSPRIRGQQNHGRSPRRPWGRALPCHDQLLLAPGDAWRHLACEMAPSLHSVLPSYACVSVSSPTLRRRGRHSRWTEQGPCYSSVTSPLLATSSMCLFLNTATF